MCLEKMLELHEGTMRHSVYKWVAGRFAMKALAGFLNMIFFAPRWCIIYDIDVLTCTWCKS